MELNSNNTQHSSSFQIVTSKQLQAAALSLNTSDSIRETFKALASFCDFTKGTHTSRPSYTTLCKITGKCKRTMIRHIQALIDLGVISVQHMGYICPRTLQRRQTNNIYWFNLSKIHEYCRAISNGIKSVTTFICGKIMKCHSHKSPEINKQLNQKQINRSNAVDPSLSDEKKEANLLLNQLKNAIVCNSKEDAWQNRGRRYFSNLDGGLYIHKSQVNDPRALIGFVKNSPAHKLALDTIKFIESLIKQDKFRVTLHS